MSKKIILIGAGQLGSRHLQGLAKVTFPSEIYVFDPSENSLRLAQERFKEMPANSNVRKIEFHRCLDLLPSESDLSIVATNADVRIKILRELSSSTRVCNIIFEKILFQSPGDYAEAGKILSESGTHAWVNCPRRLSKEYINAKKILSSDRKIKFKAHGESWGLASNAIHFIDILSFLNGQQDYAICTSELDKELIESKRKGNVEFSGKLKGVFANGSSFEMFSGTGKLTTVLIEIENADYRISLLVLGNDAKIDIEEKATGVLSTENVSLPFQSDMTHILAYDILFKGACGLTGYAESAKLHLPLIKAFIGQISMITGVQHESCPIT